VRLPPCLDGGDQLVSGRLGCRPGHLRGRVVDLDRQIVEPGVEDRSHAAL
jgi:hypothetical protein